MVKIELSPATSMDLLSRLLVASYCDNTAQADGLEIAHDAVRLLAEANRGQRNEFLELANSNHVVVRAFAVLKIAAEISGHNEIAAWCEQCMVEEQARISHAVKILHMICTGMESNGCKTAVIKSLDHWPDLGSDLDLYTTANSSTVIDVMGREFKAVPVARSLGDRLANKWNFQVPGLPELVEIHVQVLGQTGEHDRLARRVIERRVNRTVGDYNFRVPAPEERIVISTLQRVYRHFYFRLCDMIDFALLLRQGEVDFSELRRASEEAGIWIGVASFLRLIQCYIQSYEGQVDLPEQVIASAQASNDGVKFKNGFLRVSKTAAANLYGRQLVQAGLHRNLRSLARLPLLPPLAVSALIAYRLTGNDKGIW